DRIWPSRFRPMRADDDRLAGQVRKFVTAEIQSDESRARRGSKHLANRQRQEHGGIILSDVALRRVRGLLLRTARRRRTAIALGVALVAPAAWLELAARYDAWWLDGLALVLAATGIALVWTGVTGMRADWLD